MVSLSSAVLIRDDTPYNRALYFYYKTDKMVLKLAV